MLGVQVTDSTRTNSRAGTGGCRVACRPSGGRSWGRKTKLSKWLEDTELVAIRIGKNMPAPSVLHQRFSCKEHRASCQDAIDLRAQIRRPQIKVHAILSFLGLGYPLEQELRAALLSWVQAQI